MSNNWIRVRKSNRCPVCGRPDWCLVTEDRKAAICPRTPSTHPIKSGSGEFVGYLHRLDKSNDYSPPKFERRRECVPAQNMSALAKQYATSIVPSKLESFAAQMGLTVPSLRRLRIGWAFDSRAWAFPMFDAFERIIGIRLRSPDGSKFAVTGSHNGLFIATDLPDDGPLAFCEGPTSNAALLDLGYSVIGRPSCSAGVRMVQAYLDRGRRRDVVVFGDHDQEKTRPDGTTFFPGQQGAATLAQAILPQCRSVKVVIPPFSKDVRSWKQGGATRGVIDAVIRAMNYVRPERALCAQGA